MVENSQEDSDPNDIYETAETWHASGSVIIGRAKSKMEDDLASLHRYQPHDIAGLRQHIDLLRRRFTDPGNSSGRLSWDTELLVRKTQNLNQTNRISCTDPNWRSIVESLDVEAEGVCIDDIRTVEQIEFVASFAAKRQLAMTYGNHSFYLEPRHTSVE